MRRIIQRPTSRNLRGYAFDPSLSLAEDTADINQVIYKVRWEDAENFSPGPCGEYIEVVDYDPTVGLTYKPVDLNEPYILANDGLDPSESDPQFHQQMVYAVSMRTIQNFEKALGRKIIWAPRLLDGTGPYEEYVPRLRVYPHALREANAYYSPMKKAILFGYFAATPATAAHQMPGAQVFTCLSHDIIAHEVTHAILDGLHRNYNRPSNPDVLAFHEAFADIVALFQHFTFPEVLKHQIAKTRGNLDEQSLLGQLAQQVGASIGHYGSLREAIGEMKDGKWQLKSPSPEDYRKTMEPHDRGGILVAAVFEAFLTIYKSRVRDLLRIASGGSGILPEGELHPDLVSRLASEAAKTANHVLSMCIRALDYCPPVDINFGDFLRAIITADSDLVSSDPHHYRLAFINAFRRRGIYPDEITTLSEDSLKHSTPWDDFDSKTQHLMGIISKFLTDYRKAVLDKQDRKEIYEISRDFIAGGGSSERMGLHQRLGIKFSESPQFEKVTGLVFSRRSHHLKMKTTRNGLPSFQVLNLRMVSRVGPDGNQINQIVFGLIQKMGVIIKNGQISGHYTPSSSNPPPPGGIEIQGGSTLIYDLNSGRLKYSIAKPLLDPSSLTQGERKINLDRIQQQQAFEENQLSMTHSDFSHYFGMGFGHHDQGEPFALLHSK